MKKITLLVLTTLICMLVPASTFAQDNTSRLVAVRMAGGTCGALVTFEVDYNSGGGAHEVGVEIRGPAGARIRDTRRFNGGPQSGTFQFQMDSSGLIMGNEVLRVWVGMDGQWLLYFFDCGTFELAQSEANARPNTFQDLKRHTTYNLDVISNDGSRLPFLLVRVITQPAGASVTRVGGSLDLALTTGDRIGTFSFIYEACNLANTCSRSRVTFTTLNSPPNCEAVADTVYFWGRDTLEPPFIGENGVIDPDGDPMNVQITSLTNQGPSENGTLYLVEFTVSDIPPAGGEALTCSGTVLLQKED